MPALAERLPAIDNGSAAEVPPVSHESFLLAYHGVLTRILAAGEGLNREAAQVSQALRECQWVSTYEAQAKYARLYSRLAVLSREYEDLRKEYERKAGYYEFFRNGYAQLLPERDRQQAIVERHRSIAHELDVLRRKDSLSHEDAMRRNALMLELDRLYHARQSADQWLADFARTERLRDEMMREAEVA